MTVDIDGTEGEPLKHAAHAAEVVAAERVHIERARKAIGITETVDDLPLRALCLSGGGIRSASFSIGFLQALAEQRLIGRFDYMSGVSGGGYALGWWSALLRRRIGTSKLNEGLELTERVVSTFFPSGSNEPPQDPFERRYLRAHGNYLTVRTGLASPDTWAALVTIARNLTYGLVGPGLAMLFAAFALLFFAGQLATAPKVYGAWLAVVSGALAAAGWGLTADLLHGPKDAPGVRWRQSVAPLLLASACVLQAVFLLAPYGKLDSGSVAIAERVALASLWVMLLGDAAIATTRLLGGGTLVTRVRRAFLATPTTLAVVCVAVLWIHGSALYVHDFGSGRNSAEKLIEGQPHRTWLLWALLLLAHAWEWVRAVHMLREGRATGGADAQPTEGQAARVRSFVADGVSVICSAALVAALPFIISLLPPSAISSEDNWAYAGTLTLVLAIAFVLYNSIVVVSLGGQRRHRAGGQLGTEPMPGETMEREVWSQLWSKFIIVSFLLATAVTVARAVSALEELRLQEALVVAPLLVALLAAAGLLRTHGQLAKLALRVCGFAAVLGTALIALLLAELFLDFNAFGSVGGTLVFVASAILCLLTLWRSGPNTFSMHELYRNRLVRALLGASNESVSVGTFGFCDQDDLMLTDLLVGTNEKTVIRPFPLWSAAVNVTASDEVGLQERKAASFVFSPLYCGYEVPKSTRTLKTASDERAYAATSYHGALDNVSVDSSGTQLEREPLTVGAAMASSGAAFSSNTGASTQPERALLLTLLGFRLGRWFPNPALASSTNTPGSPVPKNAWTVGVPVYNGEKSVLRQVPHIIREALSQCDIKANAVYVTDGGHFENLGVYEMIRRRAMLIVAVDAGCDPNFEFDDLMNLQKKVRTDFGVEIVVNGLDALRISAEAFAKSHVALWDVIYQPALPDRDAIVGKLIYCKSTLTGTEPTDLLDYRRRVASFPHLSTVNQWFAESTFEAYRTLGLVVGREAAAVLATTLAQCQAPAKSEKQA